jgi:hypothetical protein
MYICHLRYGWFAIVCFAFHNIKPFSIIAYSAQYSGASNAAEFLSTFRAGVYDSIFISTMVVICGYFYINDININTLDKQYIRHPQYRQNKPQYTSTY